jgi:hypothetical protein
VKQSAPRRLEAHDAIGSNQGGVVGLGWELEAVARLEIDYPLLVRQRETDAALHNVEDFHVTVAMFGVGRAGPVRPAIRLEALSREPPTQLRFVRCLALGPARYARHLEWPFDALPSIPPASDQP